MSETIARIRRQCLAAGMDPDEPLATLILTLAEDQAEIRRVAGEVGEAVTAMRVEKQAAPVLLAAEQQGQLLRSVPPLVASNVKLAVAEALRRVRAGPMIAAALAGMVIAAGVGVGAFYYGRASAAVVATVYVQQAAGFVAEVATLNDGGALRGYCFQHRTTPDPDGNPRCLLPPVRFLHATADAQAQAQHNGKSK